MNETTTTTNQPKPFFQSGGWGAIQSALGSFLGGLGTGLGSGATGGQGIGQPQVIYQPAQPEKDNTALYIGIGVFALLVIIILAVVLMKKK